MTRSLFNRKRERSLRADCSGVTVIEFAFVAPVFLFLLFGMMDLGQLVYAQSVLDGTIQQAARDSSLETADTAAVDAMIKTEVQKVAPNATVTTSRSSYYDFSDIKRAEKFNDSNGDGICDNTESYTDENGNGHWDADIGKSGNGGAGDVVMYNVTVTYPRIFRVPLLGGSADRTISASAIRKNQPFADQATYGSTAGTCS